MSPEPLYGHFGVAGRQLLGGTGKHGVHHPHPWWIGRALPLLQLPGRESHVVVGERGPDSVVVRHGRLNHHLPSQRSSSRPPRHLTQELEGPLACPEVGQMKPHIGIHHTHQCHPGEVQSLGDHLSAQEDVHLPSLHPTQDLVMSPLPGGGVHIHPGQASLGKGLRHDPLHLFGAQPPEGEILRPTPATPLGSRLVVAAVVAEDAFADPMIGERDRAVGTGLHIPALTALHEAGVSAAIQEQNHLLAPSDPLSNPLRQCGREHGSAVLPPPDPSIYLLVPAEGPQVHDPHGRENAACNPLREREPNGFATCRVPPALQGGCRAPQNTQGPTHSGPYHSHVPGVVPRGFRLLVAAVVLFIHHHHTQVLQGRKDRRAGSYGDPLLAGAELSPRIVSLPVGEGRMEHGHIVTEVGPEAGHGLGRERDLRNQDDGAPSLSLDHLSQDFDVDQGLPRSGDAVKEEWKGLRIFDPFQNRLQRVGLISGRRQLRRLLHGHIPERVPHHLLRPHADDLLLLEARHNRSGKAPLPKQVGDLHQPSGSLQNVQSLSLPWSSGEELFPLRQIRHPPGHTGDVAGLHRGLPGCHHFVPKHTRSHQTTDLRPDRASTQVLPEGVHPHGDARFLDQIEDSRLPGGAGTGGRALQYQVVPGEVGEESGKRGPQSDAEGRQIVLGDPAAELQ